MEIQFSEHRCRRKDELDLRQIGRLAEDVDVALHELAEAPSLGPVRPPHIAHLQRLEWRRQLICMVRIIPGKGNSQVVAQAAVHQVRFLLRFIDLQLLSPFQNLEDQLLVVSPLLAAQVLDMLHTGRLDG